MGSHFAALGVPVGDQDAFGRSVRRIVEAAEVDTELAGGSRLLTWRDPSGAAADVLLTPHGDGLGIQCVNPYQAATTAQQVTVAEVDTDDDCPGCTIIEVALRDDDGQMLYPMLVAPAEAATSRDDLADAAATLRPARIGLLGEHIDVFATAAQFQASSGDGPAFAVESFIPLGMFGGRQPRVLCNGTVTAAEQRRNRLFDTDFWWLRVESLGAEYEVACATFDVPGGVLTGAVASVTAWACGQIG